MLRGSLGFVVAGGSVVTGQTESWISAMEELRSSSELGFEPILEVVELPNDLSPQPTFQSYLDCSLPTASFGDSATDQAGHEMEWRGSASPGCGPGPKVPGRGV